MLPFLLSLCKPITGSSVFRISNFAIPTLLLYLYHNGACIRTVTSTQILSSARVACDNFWWWILLCIDCRKEIAMQVLSFAHVQQKITFFTFKQIVKGNIPACPSPDPHWPRFPPHSIMQSITSSLGSGFPYIFLHYAWSRDCPERDYLRI